MKRSEAAQQPHGTDMSKPQIFPVSITKII